jgi:hypothetical protein
MWFYTGLHMFVAAAHAATCAGVTAHDPAGTSMKLQQLMIMLTSNAGSSSAGLK